LLSSAVTSWENSLKVPTPMGHPNLLSEDIIEEVNNEINEIGSKYNFDGYTVTLSEKNNGNKRSW